MTVPRVPNPDGLCGGVRDRKGFGLGIGVVTDPAHNGNLGSPGQFGWSGIWRDTRDFVDRFADTAAPSVSPVPA